METKIKANYTKINRDECTVSEVKDWLRNDELYYKTQRGFEIINPYAISDTYNVFVGEIDIYKIETQEAN